MDRLPSSSEPQNPQALMPPNDCEDLLSITADLSPVGVFLEVVRRTEHQFGGIMGLLAISQSIIARRRMQCFLNSFVEGLSL